MTSRWSQSAPARMAREHSSARRLQSAASREGAMMRWVQGAISAAAWRKDRQFQPPGLRTREAGCGIWAGGCLSSGGVENQRERCLDSAGRCL